MTASNGWKCKRRVINSGIFGAITDDRELSHLNLALADGRGASRETEPRP